jgi:hypothetical protein
MTIKWVKISERSKTLIYLQTGQRSGLSLASQGAGGKSGQHRVSYFLTGSRSQGWSNVTENNRRISGKGEKVG